MRRRAPCPRGFDAPPELGESKRLSQTTGPAPSQPPPPLAQARQCAQDDHRRRLTETPDRGNDREPINATRQHAIEDHNIPAVVGGEVEPFRTVANQGGRMAGLFEAVADIAGRVPFILNDETAHFPRPAQSLPAARSMDSAPLVTSLSPCDRLRGSRPSRRQSGRYGRNVPQLSRPPPQPGRGLYRLRKRNVVKRRAWSDRHRSRYCLPSPVRDES